MPAEIAFPLPEPYSDNTPQDHADMLRDHSDVRMDMPELDYAAVAAAGLIEKQAAEIARLTELLGEPCPHGHYGVDKAKCGPCSFEAAIKGVVAR